jgi:hypothetical protein
MKPTKGSIQQGRVTRDEPVEEAPGPGNGDPGPQLEWGWRIALIVWCLCFFFLAAYELWSGMIVNMLRYAG